MTDGTVGTQTEGECACRISTIHTIVSENNQNFAFAKFRECYSCVVSSGEVSGFLAVALIEAKVCTVVYLNECAILVKNDCCAISVGFKSAGVVLVKNDHRVVCCSCCSYFAVVDPLAVYSSEGLAIDSKNLIKRFEFNTGKSDRLTAGAFITVNCTERKCPAARCIGTTVVG